MSSTTELLVDHDYARFLAAAGTDVWEIDDVMWFRYNGFLRPAYLPHCMPVIERDSVRAALAKSGCLFARWDSDFGIPNGGPWWYVTRSGPYDLAQVSGNTRSKIRRGTKRLQARPATVAEIAEQGMSVCRQAVRRFRRHGFLPDEDAFHRKLRAAEAHPESVEFFGVFSEAVLVGFSENHIQGNAVFWESIWYDPDFLGDYASYVLTHEMLDHYLNLRGMEYVSDGCRSLYHATNVQQFFADKFGFEYKPARWNLQYAPWLEASIRTVFPLRHVVSRLKQWTSLDALERLHGLLLQHSIAQDYQSG